jgi:hypothetical protein
MGARAEAIATTLRPTLEDPLPKRRARTLAARLRLHPSTLYAYRARLRESGLTSALVRASPASRAAAAVCLQSRRRWRRRCSNGCVRLGRKVRMVNIMSEVGQRARAQRMKPPSRRSVERRLAREVPQASRAPGKGASAGREAE